MGYIGMFFIIFLVLLYGYGSFMDEDNCNKSSIIFSECIGGLVIGLFALLFLTQFYLKDIITNQTLWVIMALLFICFFILVYLYNLKRFKEIDDLVEYKRELELQHNRNIELTKQRFQQDYFNALKNGDKANSLECGRRYYHYLGIYDEQRIQNDLLCYLQTKK